MSTRDKSPPVVAAVDGSPAARRAARTAARLARDGAAAVVFVYVRKGPPAWLGKPYFQKRLDTEVAAANAALTDALEAAEREGVPASAEILEGPPAQRVAEFAQLRDARVVVAGPRRRRLRRSFSRGLRRRAPMPVLTVPS